MPSDTITAPISCNLALNQERDRQRSPPPYATVAPRNGALLQPLSLMHLLCPLHAWGSTRTISHPLPPFHQPHPLLPTRLEQHRNDDDRLDYVKTILDEALDIFSDFESIVLPGRQHESIREVDDDDMLVNAWSRQVAQ